VSVVGMGSGLPLVFSNLPFYLPLLFAFFSFAFSIEWLKEADNFRELDL
jgi:hypothetical protein